MIAVKLRGHRELERRMRKLTNAANTKALVVAARAGSEPIVRTAQGNAPSAIIAKGIRIVNIIRKAGSVISEIGLPGGRRPWFHGLFVELGTGPRIQKKTGRRTGSMPAEPFLRPAFDSERENAQNAFFQTLKIEIEKAARG